MARQRKTLSAIDLDKYGIDLDRYVLAMAHSRKVLEPFRRNRLNAVRQDAGAHYSDNGSGQKVPVNLIGLYESIVGTSLLSANPRFMLSTFQQSMKAAVDAMNQWVNRQIIRIGLTESLKRIVRDGLYCIGIGKVALASPAEAAVLAWGAKAGEPLVSPIDLDDWVFDTNANRFEEVAFQGHRFRVPIDAVKDSKIYNLKATKKLAPSLESRYNHEGDEKISQVGRGLLGGQEDAEDMVDLWEVYLPRHRLVITLSDDDVTGPALVEAGGYAEPLRVQNWVGPDRGPYHLLSYKTVGGNAMPKGPIQNLIDMHEIANRTFNKLDRQAERQKTNVWYSRTADGGDAERIARASDGQMIPVDRPESLKETRLGGPDQTNFAFFEETLNRFSWLAGNLDILGGLSPQAKTLGQDKMLNQNSSRVVSGMQEATVTYVENIARALCWYYWKDPYTVQHAPYSPTGMSEVQVDRYVHPADDNAKAAGELTRHGRFEDLDIQVDPYSLQHQTPQEKIAAIDQMVTQIIIPMMPLLQAQGYSFDIGSYLKLQAKLRNMPELQEIVTMAQPTPPPMPGMEGQEGAQGAPGAGMPQPGKPAQTQRTYVRENRSERTNQGTTQNLITSLSGIKPGGNPNERG